MEKSDYEKLVVGDIVYLFKIDISCHYHINVGIAVELKKLSDMVFEVTKVINGRILKVGDKVTINDKDWTWDSYRSSLHLWKNLEDGIEWWNAQIRNAEDGLTSIYEKKKKGLTRRLIAI